jgi:hypothetical protein
VGYIIEEEVARPPFFMYVRLWVALAVGKKSILPCPARVTRDEKN